MPIPTAGQKAPSFTTTDQQGKKIRLSELKGQKIMLYFYPADMTTTCTVQACNIRDHYQEIIQKGYKVFGISPDNAAKHQQFISRYQLPFDLLVDADHKIAKAYGVWGPKKLFGHEYDGVHRTTFLIDEKGKIERVINTVRSARHHEQILSA